MAEVGYAPALRMMKLNHLHTALRKRVGLPRVAADVIVRKTKSLANPGQSAVRRRMAASVMSGNGTRSRIPKDGGYLLLEPGFFAEAGPALDAARTVFADMEANGEVERKQAGANKRFLLSMLRDAEFLDHPEILAFMISRPVVDLATAYLGTVPCLSSASLWWTPPNDTEDQSQRFHRDAIDDRNLKFFLNCTDVTEEAGPLVFLPGDISERIMRKLGYVSGRLADEAVDEAGGRGNYLKLLGPANGGAVVDTCRCLHYGSRRNAVGRLVLMFQFTSFDAPRSDISDWSDGFAATGIEPDPVQKMVLGLS